jgi:hypothetical protein
MSEETLIALLNFIEYWTSDDHERIQMKQALIDFINEVHQ